MKGKHILYMINTRIENLYKFKLNSIIHVEIVINHSKSWASKDKKNDQLNINTF